MINAMANEVANTSTAPETRSYGAWDSPILAKSLASAEISFSQISPNHSKTTSEPNAADKIYYVETRPAEQGRCCIVECSFLPNSPAQLRDVLPPEYSARTSVHGYGGGAFACQYSGNLILGVFRVDFFRGFRANQRDSLSSGFNILGHKYKRCVCSRSTDPAS